MSTNLGWKPLSIDEMLRSVVVGPSEVDADLVDPVGVGEWPPGQVDVHRRRVVHLKTDVMSRVQQCPTDLHNDTLTRMRTYMHAV